MLHPNQFAVNEAWIAFRLNGAPIQTEADGAFNCVALMDAASCFILGSEFFPVNELEPSRSEIRRLLKQGQSHKQQLPRTLFVAREQPSESIAQEAMRLGVSVVQVPEGELLPFIGEALESFRERFG
jgi:hypothetical protein